MIIRRRSIIFEKLFEAAKTRISGEVLAEVNSHLADGRPRFVQYFSSVDISESLQEGVLDFSVTALVAYIQPQDCSIGSLLYSHTYSASEEITFRISTYTGIGSLNDTSTIMPFEDRMFRSERVEIYGNLVDFLWKRIS